MVQLSLLETSRGVTLSQEVTRLAARATRNLGAGHHATEAARIARAKFASWGSRDLEPADVRRVHAYFEAVLRRRIVHQNDPAAQDARKRLLAATIEADLKGAGWDAHRARAEAERLAGTACDPRKVGAARV